MALNTLPTEIILMVAKNMNPIEEIGRLSLVSRRMREILLPFLVERDLQKGKPRSMFWAAYYGNLPMLRLILSSPHPMDPNTPWLKGCTMYSWTKKPHRIDSHRISAMVELDTARSEAFGDVYPINPPNFKHWGRYIENLLLQNVDCPVSRLWSPLHLSIAGGHLEASKLLLEYGADPSIPSYGFCHCKGLGSLMHPCSEEALLYGAGRGKVMDGWDALHIVICHGRGATRSMPLLTQLLDTPGLPSHSLVGALCSAAFVGNVGLVEMLLEPPYEIDPCEISILLSDTAAIHWALYGGHEKVIIAILERANVNSIPRKNILNIPCSKKEWHIVRLILEAGWAPTWDALFFVLDAHNSEVTQLFIDYGLPCDSRDHKDIMQESIDRV